MLIPSLPLRHGPRRPAKSPASASPPPAPVNANVLYVLVLASDGLIIVFDREVILDTLHPPTTWTFGDDTAILPGSLNFGTACYIPPNSGIGPGNVVIIRADDPGARTVDGGYVNAVTTVVSDL